MTRRLLIGNRGSDYGLWVSKPGYDVVTAAEDELLLSTSIVVFQARETLKGNPGQPLVSGVVTDTQSIPDEKYRPMAIYLPYMAGEERIVDPPYAIGSPSTIIGGWSLCTYGYFTECSITVSSEEIMFSNRRKSQSYIWHGPEGDRIACKVLSMEIPS